MSQQSTPQSSPPAHHDRIKGVFSTQEIRKVGTGTTQRKTVYKGFYFIEQDEDGMIDCQPLNSNYVPSGQKRKITMEELIEKFSPEPEFYLNSVYPKMQELARAIDNADSHRDKGETFAAEYEYGTALKVDEENVRANFGIGLTYLQRGENNKADDIFERLVKLDAAFEPEHKHMFNDFGINLRKAKMYGQAVTYYTRALEMTKDDENLHVNVARALFETKNVEGCVEHLINALELAPKQEQATKFLEWLMDKRQIPGAAMDRVRQALARETAVAPPPAPEKKAPSPPEDQTPADAS
ncbi:MAG: tetratricopeptide repeat protein [Deltaproteobacteria bacterium]|jgi:tetratricopeptide (TPR) repeat protein|nr:tetratricopeptide repeat protein [Deltaproteobacteria bacterium]